MLKLTIALLCATAVGYLVLLLRSYEYLTQAELKRQARSGNRQAKAVYTVRGPFGPHVFVFLWSLIGILSSTMIVLLEGTLWTWTAVLIGLVVTVLVHAILPWSKYPEPSLSMASFSAPVISRILRYFSPPLKFVERFTGEWISRTEIRRINSKEELLDILEHTRIEDDPFSADELGIAVHALTFGDKKITQIMTPRSVVRSVRAEDVLSPVLLGELHDSGYSRFPVTESQTGNYIGILYSKDLSDLHGNKMVSQVMRSELYYVNEFTALDNVLNAFLRTQHHLFLVVNEFEEVVGIITIEDVLEQIIGRKIVDEFDKYEDLRAVAMQNAHKVADSRESSTV